MVRPDAEASRTDSCCWGAVLGAEEPVAWKMRRAMGETHRTDSAVQRTESFAEWRGLSVANVSV